MNNFNWIVKNNRSNRDVSMTLVKSRDKQTVSFVFRNGTANAITTADSKYVLLAIWNQRVYFKAGNEEIGFKMTSKNTKVERNYYTSVNNQELIKFAETHSGDYRMLYDKETQLYYIDTE